MSVNYYDKQTEQLYGISGSTRTWIGSKAAHDAEAISEKLPNNVLLAILNTGLFYRDQNGTETAITQGGGSDIQKVVMPTASSDEEGSIYQYIGLTDTALGFTHGFFYECVSDGSGGYEWVNLDVMSGGGSSIQVSTLPTASATELSKVYQYLGSDTADYKHGYFYECTFDGTDYKWTYLDVDNGDGNKVQYDALPAPDSSLENVIVQYTGVTNANYTNAYFYKCISDGQTPATYSWKQIDVQGEGQTIQVKTIPTEGISELGHIYQFVGADTQDYKHGYFYECISDNGVYKWVNIPVQDNSKNIQITSLPTASVDELNNIYEYIGSSTATLNNGFFYKCVYDDVTSTYKWENIKVQEDSGSDTQYDTMPTADSTREGDIIQYTGDTTVDYTNGYFYKCINDNGTYKWEVIQVQDGGTTDADIATVEKTGIVKPDNKSIFIKPDGTLYTNIWIGTKEQYDAKKYSIPYDTLIYIIDFDGIIADDDLIVNGVKIVPWANGTVTEISAMLAAADEGTIDLTDYWSLGDERVVHVSAMAATDSTPAMSEQDVVYVLSDDEYMGQSGIHYVIRQVNGLSEKGIYNSNGTHIGAWRDSTIRTALNGEYYNALPADFKGLLKPFTVSTGDYSSSHTTATLETTIDKIALFAEAEVTTEVASGYAGNTSPNIEKSALYQIECFTNTDTRVSMNDCMSRSVGIWSDANIVSFNAEGKSYNSYANTKLTIKPFACI